MVPLQDGLSPSGMGSEYPQTMAPGQMSPMDWEENRVGIMGKDVEFSQGLGLNLNCATDLLRGLL